jgi:hypothetical protein
MKLCEVVKQSVNWDTKSEKQQLALVRRSGRNIYKISNPSEAVQLAAVKQRPYAIICIKNPLEAVQLAAVNNHGYVIQYIKNPTQTALLTALKDLRFINNQDHYELFVKKQFANNTILMKKWLRYGEAKREQS